MFKFMYFFERTVICIFIIYYCAVKNKPFVQKKIKLFKYYNSTLYMI